MPVTRNGTEALTQKVAFILIILIAICFIAVWGEKVLIPLVFALLFSLVLMPVVEFMEKRLRFHRVLASAAAVFILLAIFTGVLYFTLTQFGGFSNEMPKFKEQLENASTQIQNWVSQTFHIAQEKQKAYLDQAVTKMPSAGGSMVGQTVYAFSSIVLFIILTMFFTFFILMYRSRITTFFLYVFSRENNLIVKDIVDNTQQMIKGYIRGILLEMAIVTATCTIAFSLLGIPYAFLLGLMTGVFNIIPYIGIFSSMAISMLVTLAASGIGTKALLVVAVIVPMHLIDSNIILPFLVGSRVRVNAFMSFLAIVVGGLVWGIPGMFLAVPLTGVAKIIFDRVESLNHWAVLFGDEKIVRRKFGKKIKPGGAS